MVLPTTDSTRFHYLVQFRSAWEFLFSSVILIAVGELVDKSLRISNV